MNLHFKEVFRGKVVNKRLTFNMRDRLDIVDAGDIQQVLETALSRPLQMAHNGESDLFILAAAYLFGIAKHHPFIDGNKRTAFVAADLFLYFNGTSVEADQTDVIVFVLGIAAGEIDEDGASRFLRDHSVKIED